MPGRCEYIMSSCRPAPYREPRKPPSTVHPALRFAAMHLKPYPKLQKKDLQLEPCQDHARGQQQGALRAERAVRQPCPPGAVPANGTAGRQPLSAISTNTLCKGGSASPKASAQPPSDPWGRKGALLPVSLLLLSSGLEQEGSLTLYQGDSGDGQLDIWAVIKPGNTREKIAIFAGQQCGQPSGRRSPATGGSRGDESPASLRTVSMKAKGCWEVEGSMAKRRKCSSDADKRRSCDSLPQEAGEREPLHGEGEGQGEGGEEGGKTLSVVEMVAYLEQRANEQQADCSKPLHSRASSLLTVPKVGAPPLEDPPGGPEAWEGREEEGESVRVLDMVAKLESECLKRQSEREGGSDLSRNSSLRRSVCRVLLAGAGSGAGSGAGPEACSASAPPRPDPAAEESRAGAYPCDGASPAPAGPACEAESGSVSGAEPECSQSAVKACAQQEVQEEAMAEGDSRVEHREEPLPGMLFFSPQQEQEQPLPAEPLWDRRPAHTAARGQEAAEVQMEKGEEERGVARPALVPFPLRRLVSHRFLEMRFKIQLLLEPQQYMALLPHHIIVKIFSLLPTQTLAALKCTCHYFKFIIECYGVRPADSRWVCDPRYRDDPCKQCKRRYGRGDVSLCRWHHKPYCQALPYGPGYWMCCYGSHKDTPGCNVGLHDNRWVPAFHSINMPIYKKARESEEDS